MVNVIDGTSLAQESMRAMWLESERVAAFRREVEVFGRHLRHEAQFRTLESVQIHGLEQAALLGSRWDAIMGAFNAREADIRGSVARIVNQVIARSDVRAFRTQ